MPDLFSDQTPLNNTTPQDVITNETVTTLGKSFLDWFAKLDPSIYGKIRYSSGQIDHVAVYADKLLLGIWFLKIHAAHCIEKLSVEQVHTILFSEDIYRHRKTFLESALRDARIRLYEQGLLFNSSTYKLSEQVKGYEHLELLWRHYTCAQNKNRECSSPKSFTSKTEKNGERERVSSASRSTSYSENLPASPKVFFHHRCSDDRSKVATEQISPSP